MIFVCYNVKQHFNTIATGCYKQCLQADSLNNKEHNILMLIQKTVCLPHAKQLLHSRTKEHKSSRLTEIAHNAQD